MHKLIPVLVLALVALAGTVLSFDSEDEPALISELAWLEGRWVLEDETQYIEETWGPAREDAIVGSLRWARGGKVWLYELFSIEESEEHGLVFYLRHFDRNLAPWDSEKDGPLTYPLHSFDDNRVIFENTERDSPRRFIYERDGKVLAASLEGPEGRDAQTFRFKRDR